MIGIGITTRNRPHVLEACLRHFRYFAHGAARIVVVDDASENWKDNYEVFEKCKPTLNAMYKKTERRLGIAGAKNECLRELVDCQHVFLFDDDAWPHAHFWADKWIACAEFHGLGHMSWAAAVPGIRPLVTIGVGDNQLTEWDNCLGVCLYFSRKCLRALGGFDESGGALYGYEHAQMSQRATVAGHTGGLRYAGPTLAHEWIYSLDISLGWLKKEPTLFKWRHGISSACTDAEKAAHPENARLLQDAPVYIAL